ncbi:GNAT family N-acetyltransferase [Streptosporangium amethystogenes]|uniref:GNAT family N-acetyltransferase n=1 Tax=Streptosporangium amethystogenes TaxID=2002 RepID=UPI0037B96E59
MRKAVGVGETAGGQVIVEVLGPKDAKRLSGEVCAAYRTSFGAPPNNEGAAEFEHQRASYADLLERRGFLLSVARLDGLLVGFAYGAFLRQGGQWWNGMRDPLPAGFTDESGSRTWQLVDLGVLPGHRKRGIAKQLTEAALAGCGAQRAALAVEPRLEGNQRLYRSWGWRRIGSVDAPPSSINDVYDIYLLEDLPTGRP